MSRMKNTKINNNFYRDAIDPCTFCSSRAHTYISFYMTAVIDMEFLAYVLEY